jgi:tryptophanyl-tRNA synthetase
LELTRDLAQRFNQRYGDTFTVPDPYIPQIGARVMSLDDASKKMSKSNPNPASYIAMLDEPDVIRKKISRATTDSEREVRFAPGEKPELSNLISIYALVTGRTIQSIEEQYADGPGYGPFKKDLAEAVVACLEPLQQRYREIRESGQVHEVLAQGAVGARERAAQILTDVKNKMGFLPPLRR